MLRGIHDNSDVSGPDGKVARLRACHPTKFVDPGVEFGRIRIRIRESSLFIDSLDKMRAVIRGLPMMAGIQRSTEDRQPLTEGQWTKRSHIIARVGACFLQIRYAVGRNTACGLLLGVRGRTAQNR